jgi:hypothetical protein
MKTTLPFNFDDEVYVIKEVDANTHPCTDCEGKGLKSRYDPHYGSSSLVSCSSCKGRGVLNTTGIANLVWKVMGTKKVYKYILTKNCIFIESHLYGDLFAKLSIDYCFLNKKAAQEECDRLNRLKEKPVNKPKSKGVIYE